MSDEMGNSARCEGSGVRPPDPSHAAPRTAPQPYDFSHRTLLSAHELRKLEADHLEFLRALAMRLSIHFRMEFDLTLVSLRTPTFRQFASGLAQPTHLTLFKVEPLRGVCVLEISPALGRAMTDRLLGGPGQATDAAGELSEIEVALLDQVTQLITDGWCGHWGRWLEMKPALLGHESDPRYLQTATADSAMLVATAKGRLGEGAGEIKLAFPFATLDPLIQKLRAELKPAAGVYPEGTATKQIRMNPAFDDVNIAVVAELPGPQMPARAIPQFKVGEVLNLSADAVNHVQLCLGGLPRFAGRLGTCDHRWAVEVTEVLKT